MPTGCGEVTTAAVPSISNSTGTLHTFPALAIARAPAQLLTALWPLTGPWEPQGQEKNHNYRKNKETP